MGNALFADISHFQEPAEKIDWPAYVAWSKAGDGTARLVVKATEGTGYTDPNFEDYWAAALAHDVGVVAAYHYARPDLHPGTSGAQAEAKWFVQVVGHRLREGDRLMLDLEQNESSAWAQTFGQALHDLLPRGVKPVLYDSLGHIKQFLQNPELPKLFDLAVAAWHPLEEGPPATPTPWQETLWWQWSDNTAPNPVQDVPGIGHADLNVWLGASPEPPPAPEPPAHFKEQQAADVWATTPFDATTGMHAAWLQAYERNIVCGPPIGHEFKTVDWGGHPIVCQYFASGVRIEYYVEPAPGQPAGSNHGYTYNSKLW